jgi:hypothetical protein
VNADAIRADLVEQAIERRAEALYAPVGERRVDHAHIRLTMRDFLRDALQLVERRERKPHEESVEAEAHHQREAHEGNQAGMPPHRGRTRRGQRDEQVCA